MPTSNPSAVKKWLWVVLKISAAVFFFITLYVLAAITLPLIPVNKDMCEAEGDICIYILSNGVHTDFVLPIKNEVKDWSKQVKAEHTLANDSLARYIGFGWGDKGFFVETPSWSDLKASTAFKAMFF